MTQDTQLLEVTKVNGLEPTKAELILNHFTGFLEDARKWESDAKAIVITDPSQTVEMKKAREARLALKEIRVNAEKVRKELKENSLREGKAIDGIANVIKAVIEPIEEHLEKQEKFAERIEAERKARIFADRISELQQYVKDVNLYNIEGMSEEGFQELLKTSRLALEAQKEAEAKAEAERIAKEKAEAEEQERIRLENNRLKAEAEAREKEIATERAKAEKERKDMEEAQRLEREAREKVEAELRAKKEAEETAKREAEAKAKADEEARIEAERQALLAPEKDKLAAFAERIKAIEAPKDLSKEAQDIVNVAERNLLAISQEIKEWIKSL